MAVVIVSLSSPLLRRRRRFIPAAQRTFSASI
jgi:hypothetical protein